MTISVKNYKNCVTKKVIQIYTRQKKKKKIQGKLTVNKKYHTQLYMWNKYNMYTKMLNKQQPLGP